ncbi:MAG: ATPase, T2SS/T4P/T4SS family [Endomicrobiia bacterium]
MLLKLGLLNQQQLDSILEQQKQTGEKLGELLINSKLVSEEILFAVLAKQFNIQYISLTEYGEIPKEVLDLVPEKLVKTYNMIPIEFDLKTKTITVAMCDPLDLAAIENLSLMTKYNVKTVVARKREIFEVIDKYYTKKDTLEEVEKQVEAEFDTGEVEVIEEEQEEDSVDGDSAPLVKAVNYIIEQAITMRTSDILIEPQDKNVRIRYRIDGEYHDQKPFPKKLLPSIVARIKIMSKLDITERRKPQDGRIKLNFAGKAINLRVSILPSVFGEKVCIRVIDSSALCLPLSELGFDEQQFKIFEKAINQPHGMILVTGPTGSGKSTTLYSALNMLNTPDVNIMTVEDPVEVVMYGLNQVNVNEKAELTFAAALRSFLRQDPDIIMVGEIRDKETIEIAINAALTGHLVLSTLHTNDASSTITRLLNMDIEPFLISSTLNLVVAQKLVRRICNNCREAYKVNLDQLISLGVTPEMVNNAQEITIYRGRGCQKCNNGYKGRVGVHEVLDVNETIKELILKQASHFEIKEVARQMGMNTLRESALKKMLSGITTVEEVIKNTLTDEVQE